jgi:hypothetical protein
MYRGRLYDDCKTYGVKFVLSVINAIKARKDDEFYWNDQPKDAQRGIICRMKLDDKIYQYYGPKEARV